MPGSPEHEAQAELPSQSSVVDCRNRTHASWLVLHSCRVRFAQATVLVSNDTMVLCLGLRRKQLNRPSRLLKIACLLLLVCIISCSSSQGFAGVPSGKRKSCGHKGISRGASRWWTAFNTCDCLATRIQHAFETQMQTEDVPVLQSWDAYQSSLPVREGGLRSEQSSICDPSCAARQRFGCRSEPPGTGAPRIEIVWHTFQPQPNGANPPPSFQCFAEVWNWAARTVSPTTCTCHLPTTMGIAIRLNLSAVF